MKNKKYLILIIVLAFIFIAQFDVVSSLVGLKKGIFLSLFLYMFLVKKSLLTSPVLALFLGFIIDFSLNSAFLGVTAFIFLLYLQVYTVKKMFFSAFIIDCIFYFLCLINISFSSVSPYFIFSIFFFNILNKFVFAKRK
ncbi:hypothetical protein KA001_01285 [Patescibacteria group bacterium]|nr:hypothetical protein [Patescibacteria group bacterium]